KTNLQISPARNVYPLSHRIKVNAIHTFCGRHVGDFLADFESMTTISAGVRVPMNNRKVDSSNAASPGRWLVTGQVDRTSRLLVSITWSLLAMETKTNSVFPVLSSNSSEG